MADSKAADQGVHYHYHFYGYGAAPQAPGYAADGTAAPGPGPGAAGQAPPAYGQPPFTPPFPPPFPPPYGPEYGPQAGPQPGAGANPHRHPSADSLVKGLLVGAGAAYLLTNETAQRTIMRTAVQVWAVLQNSIEELKERLHDAEAEVVAEAAAAAPETPEAKDN